MSSKRERGIEIGQLFDMALVEGVGLKREEREALIATAKSKAFILCTSTAERRFVTARAIEAALVSACMGKLDRVEIEDAIRAIDESDYLTLSRKEEMFKIADRHLAKLK